MKSGCTGARRSVGLTFANASFGVSAIALAVAGCSSSATDNPSDQSQGGAAGFQQGMGGGPAAGAAGFQPGMGGYQPGAGGYQPGMGGYQPGAGGYQPGMGGQQPGMGGYQPGMGGQQPGMGGVQQGSGGIEQGGNIGSGGGPGNGGQGAGGGGPTTAPPCITDPAAQGVILGDSYVTGFLTPALQPYLGQIDPTINQYKNYAGAGCSMATGGACTGIYGNVPAQATAAHSAQPNAEFVIMDGGGNDILVCDAAQFPGCGTVCASAGSSTNTMCQTIVQKAVSTAEQLMQTTASYGVKDVLYFFYPHVPAKNGGYSEILDYSEPLAKASCDGAAAKTGGKLNCHFVDLVEPFKAAGGDMNPQNFASDQIHPGGGASNDNGQKIIAKVITDFMKANCLGQASGCCK